MPYPRPSVYPDFCLTGTRTAPGGGETNSGYSPNQRPPSEEHNFLFGTTGDWVRYFDQQVQAFVIQQGFDATVGSGGTYADLNALSAAIVGGAVIHSVLVISNITVSSTQVIASTVSDLAIYFKKGTVIAKGASTTPGISIAGQRIDLFGARMSSFSGVSDVAIQLETTAKNCRIQECNFVSCTTTVNDLGNNNNLANNIEEV